ncbi:MAG TPA: hypothetical protein VFJ65_08800 [Solirubrobacterales bacterium]|nr:hypothetical protein [Solirubrobacterales bacterium]
MNLETEERAELEGLLRRELEAQRQELDRELVRRAYRIHELEGELQQMEREFKSSLSWRITFPLRMLRSLFARLRSR